MKKALILFTLSLFALAFTADGWTQYRNKKGKFTINYPNDWVKVEKGKKAVTFVRPISNGEKFSENISINMIKIKSGVLDMDKYTELYQQNIEKQFNTKIDKTTEHKMDGRDARTIEYDVDYEGKKLGMMQSWVFEYKKLILVTMAYDRKHDDVDDFKNTYKEMISSFDFIEK